MYLIGAEHANKKRSVDLLQELVRNEERLVTSIEVYQEILHRYTSIRRLDAIDPAMDTLSALVDEILDFGMDEIRKARMLIGSVDEISVRDALHAAVMERAGVTRILSFDSGFDSCPGIERLY